MNYLKERDGDLFSNADLKRLIVPLLIEQLLDSWGKVNLFTRPRRFGKTLNMSMLRN
jgi:hypothetical protein